MARRALRSATFPLFDWADACDLRRAEDRRAIARPRRRGSRERGEIAYLSGLAAEQVVARHYTERGHSVLASRWRGKSGEIDLICQDGDGLICIEVKKARDFTQAAHALDDRQAGRIWMAANEYLADMPKGMLTAVRIDVALVNAAGDLRILPNAVMM